MKALSLWQPWAQLVVLGDKAVETRGWPAKIRGRVAIHASRTNYMELLQRIPASELRFFQEAGVAGFPEPPLGAVVGTVEIYDCQPIEKLYNTRHDTPKERAFGDWTPGRYGFLLRDPVLFDQPVRARGRQGFWNWDGGDGNG